MIVLAKKRPSMQSMTYSMHACTQLAACCLINIGWSRSLPHLPAIWMYIPFLVSDKLDPTDPCLMPTTINLTFAQHLFRSIHKETS